MSREGGRFQLPDWVVWLAALAGPGLVTAVLVGFSNQIQRDYVFIYLGLVAVVGVLRGLWPALACAAVSFLLVDYFFVPPVGTLTIADEQDIVNLVAFLVIAGIVGLLASRRRRVLLESEALTRQLRESNSELIRLNREQAEAATAALRLSRSEQQIQALQETDRLRRELLANVSHELRTPLGTILTESTATAGTATGEDAERRLRNIASEARRLKALVDDMLDMTVIEGGALHLDSRRRGRNAWGATGRGSSGRRCAGPDRRAGARGPSAGRLATSRPRAFHPDPGQLAVAMQRELRPAVLNVLRETALRITADHTDRQLARYLPTPTAPLEFRGRIVLCVPVRAGMEERIRAVARYATTQEAKFTVVTVRTRALSNQEKGWLGTYAALAYQLRGEFVRLEGRSVAAALAEYIRASQATEVVLGHRRRSRWPPMDTTSELIRRLAGVDIHILRVRPTAGASAITTDRSLPVERPVSGGIYVGR